MRPTGLAPWPTALEHFLPWHKRKCLIQHLVATDWCELQDFFFFFSGVSALLEHLLFIVCLSMFE